MVRLFILYDLGLREVGAEGINSHLFDFYGVQRLAVFIGLKLAYGIDHVHTLDYLAESRVKAVQLCDIRGENEELTARRVISGGPACH